MKIATRVGPIKLSKNELQLWLLYFLLQKDMVGIFASLIRAESTDFRKTNGKGETLANLNIKISVLATQTSNGVFNLKLTMLKKKLRIYLFT